MKRFNVLIITMLCVASAFAQSERQVPYTQITFGASASLNCPLGTISYASCSYLKSSYALTPGINVGVKQRIWKNLSANVSVGVKMYNAKYKFAIMKDENKGWNEWGNLIDGVGINIPISLQYETMRPSLVNFSAEAGICFNMPTNKNSACQIDYICDDALFSMNYSITEKSLLMSYFAKIGIIFNTRQSHTFTLSLFTNISPNSILNGSYSVSLPDNRMDYGQFGQQASNLIGLELVYGLPVWKK